MLPREFEVETWWGQWCGSGGSGIVVLGFVQLMLMQWGERRRMLMLGKRGRVVRMRRVGVGVGVGLTWRLLFGHLWRFVLRRERRMLWIVGRRF
jgi:hypothetical protein